MDKIKYHQNGTGPEYGPDHKLTDNWDPDQDYGNEYVKVYFRIETEGYDSFSGYHSEEGQHLFWQEIRDIFEGLGWTWSLPYLRKEKRTLYLHPQSISGEVLKNEVKIIAEALQNGVCTHLRWVDLYDTVYDITDDEYKSYLETTTKIARKLLFEKCKTKRKTKFFYVSDKCRQVASKIGLKRLSDDGCLIEDTVAIEFVRSIMEEMAREGLLVTEKDRHGNDFVRSLNITELTEFQKRNPGVTI